MLENVIKLLELGFTKKEILKILGICCCVSPMYQTSFSSGSKLEHRCQTCGDK